jgi:hypothetical protein
MPLSRDLAFPRAAIAVHGPPAPPGDAVDWRSTKLGENGQLDIRIIMGGQKCWSGEC